MRRVVSYLFCILFFGLAGLPAHAQGNICRTASVGSTARNCASEDYVTKSIGAIPANVSSIDSRTGTFTTGNGLDSTAGNVIELTAARRTLPTVSIVTPTSHTGGFGANGSGTYTTPAGALWIEIDLQGAGGGGGGGGSSPTSGTSGGNTCWNTSGAACTSPIYQAGGGSANSSSLGGSGGTISGSGTCNWAVAGASAGDGGPSIAGQFAPMSGAGGNSFYGGAGGASVGANAGKNAAANSGSGGSGGGVTLNGNPAAGGGAAGAHCHAVIDNPAASYTFAVGSKGTKGAAGTNGVAGGDGADGQIVVYEHYGS